MASSPYRHSDRDLLRRIARSAGGRAGYKQLVRELGMGGGHERRLLVEQLTRMVARGELLRDAREDMWSLPQRAETSNTQNSSHARRPFAGFEAVARVPGDTRSSRERLVGGRLDLHRDGFGFVRADAASTTPGQTGDIFIPPNDLNGAMHGDQVLVDEAPPARDGRRSGRIARVLTRRNPTVVGIFHYADAPRRSREAAEGFAGSLRGNFITPMDERVASLIVIPEGAEIVAATPSAHRTLGEDAQRAARTSARKHDPKHPLEGLAVDVEITDFPTPGRPARGRVVEVLGHPDDFGVDVEIIIRKHAIPHTFPPAVLAEADVQAARTVAAMTNAERDAREDFRAFPVVTIDGETARDFDDAVHVRPLANGHTELQVHIADVSYYVQPGSPLDTEARVRGNSVYFPDRAVPMLPHALSSGMCSLLPNEDRAVLSCVMEIDDAGEIASFRVAEGLIRSARRCTYTTVQHCLDAAPTKELSSGPERSGVERPASPSAEDLAERERIALEQPNLPAAFDAMLTLALKLNAKRVRRGSIDFDLPEPIVEFDPDGNMKAIVRSERGWAHRLIEEFMLSANECVAHWLEWQGIASIYRIHEMPDAKRIVEFEETAAAFGQTLGIGTLPVKRVTMKTDRRHMQSQRGRGGFSRGNAARGAPQQHDIVPQSIPVTPQMYQRLVRRISGHAEERILAYLMLRSLKQAKYAEKNEGHFALASPSYTHFTSPIRRYPDLIVHRLLRAMLAAGADPHGGPIRSDDPQPWGEGKVPAHRGQGSEGKMKPSGPSTLGPQPSLSSPLSPEELTDIAIESSQAERRAADAERELIEWKKMKFMADKVGDDFRAMIMSVTKYGFFVELEEMFIEGLVPLGSLTGDFYSFRDTDRTICGARTGHCFRVGERVEVILDRIDRQQRRLQFALLPGTEPVPTSARPAKPSGKKRAKSADTKKAGKPKGKKRKDRHKH
jgi:ribonuclease R